MKEELATQLESGALRFERDLPGPIERIWDYLVDPDKRTAWFCHGTTGEKAGDAFTLSFDHRKLTSEPVPETHKALEDGIEMGARLTAIDPPHLFAFRWDDDGEETRIELSAHGDRVRLVLTQTPPADFEEFLGMAGGWQAHLGLLIDALGYGERRGFWTEHDEAVEQYRAVLNRPRGVAS